MSPTKPRKDAAQFMKQSRRTAALQFIKFSLVGVSNTLISLAVYYFFLWVNQDWYLFGNAAGWIISVANAFFWNNRFVFADQSAGKKGVFKKLGKTYLSYAATFFLSTGLLHLEVDILGWSAIISPILNLLVTIPLNFLLNKFWAFR